LPRCPGRFLPQWLDAPEHRSGSPRTLSGEYPGPLLWELGRARGEPGPALPLRTRGSTRAHRAEHFRVALRKQSSGRLQPMRLALVRSNCLAQGRSHSCLAEIVSVKLGWSDECSPLPPGHLLAVLATRALRPDRHSPTRLAGFRAARRVDAMTRVAGRCVRPQVSWVRHHPREEANQSDVENYDDGDCGWQRHCSPLGVDDYVCRSVRLAHPYVCAIDHRSSLG